jgi:hypothetical protein
LIGIKLPGLNGISEIEEMVAELLGKFYGREV